MAKEEIKASPPIRSGDPRLTAPELTEQAFGLTKHEGKWTIVELRYDIKSGQARVFKSTPEDGREASIEQFKIAVALSGLLG